MVDKEEKQDVTPEATGSKVRRNLAATDKAAQEAIEQVEQEVTTEPKQLIYIGPNLSGGRLATSYITLGGFPAYLEDVAKDRPEIRLLFVPVNELAASKAELRVTGSVLQQAYVAVAAKEGGV